MSRRPEVLWHLCCALAVGALLFRFVSPEQADTVLKREKVDGTEVVTLVLVSGTCAATEDPEFVEGYRTLVEQVDFAAESKGWSSSKVGVALDSDISTGLEVLDGLGDFDEVSVGRSWKNHMALQFFWAADSVHQELPMVVVLQRTISFRGSDLDYSREMILGRFSGPVGVKEWAETTLLENIASSEPSPVIVPGR